MILNKWNYEKHKYDPYEIPDTWDCRWICFDLDIKVNCPQCGKELIYGQTYTSLEIHTELGFGYGVCKDCYNEELKRRKKYRDD